MLVLYALVAICGYYYFGCGAHELVTADLKTNSPISGMSLIISGLTVDKLVSAFILCNAFTTYPNLLLVIQVRPEICDKESGSMPFTECQETKLSL